MVSNSKSPVIVVRPAEDRAEVRLENEPDTPMHHAHRGLSSGSWKFRSIRWARIVTVFLLVVVTVAWVFVDLEDLNIRQRSRSRSGGRVMNELPEQSDISISILRSPLLLEGGEHLPDADGDYGIGSAARDEWLPLSEEIPVQIDSKDTTQFAVDRSLKVVFLLPPCCNSAALSEEETEACHMHVMQACAAEMLSDCYERAVRSPPCGNQKPSPANSKLTYTSALSRAVPYLKDLGWADLKLHDSPLESQCKLGDNKSSDFAKKAAHKASEAATLILAEAGLVSEMLASYPKASFIAIDTSPSGTLPLNLSKLVLEPRVVSVWKSQTLLDASLQNGPLLNGHSHLSKLIGHQGKGEQAQDDKVNAAMRQPPLTQQSLAKIRSLLNHAQRFRFPLDCGGSLDHLRFLGGFYQEASHWHPPPLARRTYDVALIRRDIQGRPSLEVGEPGDSLLQKHWRELSANLKSYGESSGHAVIVKEDAFSDYDTYLQQLQQTKVLIVPLGLSEVLDLDFEAMLSGCLVVKIEPETYRAYPDAFQADTTVKSLSPTLDNLESTLSEALKDLEHAQRVADRAYHHLLETGDARRYAADLDQELASISQILETRGA